MLKMKKVAEKDNLRLRVAQLKTRFKKGADYTAIYQYEFGTQSEEQLNKIRMVWNLRQVDKEITENLEKIAKKIKP